MGRHHSSFDIDQCYRWDNLVHNLVHKPRNGNGKLMKMTSVPAWSATMTVGQIRGYHGSPISPETLHDEIRTFQKALSMEEKCAVKVIKSKIQFEDYYEYCWDISVINYPRFPKTFHALETFTLSLAQYLLEKLEQNRITVCLPDGNVMLESDDAEEN